MSCRPSRCSGSRSRRPLYQSVMALPEIYRIVLVLFYYEELSVREIGALLKLETSAVTTRLSRAGPS